ncbi:MAG: hypothetical protein NTV80_05510, partial [Verrucomicrobia bacterium]|nr:hypothetical protein [Verrucomicrobiota bacterium]
MLILLLSCEAALAAEDLKVTFTLLDTQFHVLPMRTRFPFHYGIASMTALPHLFVSVDLVVDGVAVRGLSSEGLPPKWFTKNPDTPFELDLAEMLAVIQNASRIAENAAQTPVSFFAWWQALYEEQARWATLRSQPALLANLGVSLLERAVLDGLCRAKQTPLQALLRSGELQIDLGQVHSELQGISLMEVLPMAPLSQVAVRHTVGLADPLRVSAASVLADGLPYSLEESIGAYGLRYFKIKLSGRIEVDLPRLTEITEVLTENCTSGFKVTLDGNEQFSDFNEFRTAFETLSANGALAPLFQSLLMVEQPLHRDHALKNEIAGHMAAWPEAPNLIIDESDGSLEDLPRALDLGYCGTSHKNCKGVFKGIANACLLEQRRRGSPGKPFILSAEDLSNIGPVALLQDLAVVATLGI